MRNRLATSPVSGTSRIQPKTEPMRNFCHGSSSTMDPAHSPFECLRYLKKSMACRAASTSKKRPRSSPVSRSLRCLSHARRTSRPVTIRPSTTSRAYCVTGSSTRAAAPPECLIVIRFFLSGYSEPYPGRRRQSKFGQERLHRRRRIPGYLDGRVRHLVLGPKLVDVGDGELLVLAQVGPQLLLGLYHRGVGLAVGG